MKGHIMNDSLKNRIEEFLQSRVSTVGFAPVERFQDAPQKHHPENICKGAKTVIVFGKPLPKGVLTSPDYNLHTLHRSYHTVYKQLDVISLDLCSLIESIGDYYAVMVPSYAPMTFHG